MSLKMHLFTSCCSLLPTTWISPTIAKRYSYPYTSKIKRLRLCFKSRCEVAERLSEVVVHWCSVREMFLKILKKFRETTCAGVFFFFFSKKSCRLKLSDDARNTIGQKWLFIIYMDSQSSTNILSSFKIFQKAKVVKSFISFFTNLEDKRWDKNDGNNLALLFILSYL